jgi:hypothetical protein
MYTMEDIVKELEKVEFDAASMDARRKQLRRQIKHMGGTVDDDDNDLVKALIKRLGTSTDPAFTPRPFRGAPSDDGERWIATFERYLAMKEVDETTALNLFQILMTDDAADWLRGQPDDVTSNRKELFQAFRQRYTMSDVQRWRQAKLTWQRQQKPDESVDAYVSAMRKAAKLIPIEDETTLRFTIVTGFRPSISQHVIRSGATTLEDAIAAARVADASEGPSNDVTIDKLTKTVELMATELQHMRHQMTAGAVAAIDDDGRGDGRSRSRTSGHQLPAGRHQRQAKTYDSRRRTPTPDRRSTSATRPGINKNTSHKPDKSRVEMLRDCGKCGIRHLPMKCPAYGLTCHNCSRTGHFSRVCKNRQYKKQ